MAVFIPCFDYYFLLRIGNLCIEILQQNAFFNTKLTRIFTKNVYLRFISSRN